MKITRDVILDLLPLYLADEASQDTRRLVEQFLADDPTLTKLVEQADKDQWMGEIPVPLDKEHELIAFEKTKNLLFQQKLFLALAVGTTLLFMAFRFDANGVEWLWTNSPQMGWVTFMVSTLFWIAFGNLNWQLSRKD